MLEYCKKRICITRSNPVKPDSRVEKEAWSLKRAGYNVFILAWDRDNNHKAHYEKIRIVDEVVTITRLGHRASYGEGFKNIVPYLFFQLHMFIWLIQNKDKIDIIHACDFDTAYTSFVFAKLFKKKFVFDIFDFIAGEPKSLFERIIKKVQFLIINNADATIICTEDRIKQIEGSKPQKLTIIHNSPFKEIMNNRLYDNFDLNKEKIKIVYVGILQDFRLLKEMTECISENSEYELHIGGFGKYENYFKEASQKYKNIFFYGRLPYNQTIELELKCDIMTAIYDPSIENHRFAAPNKFYEALMLGKPLIMVKGTGMADIVKKYNIGILIDYSKESFCNVLKVISSKINLNYNNIKNRTASLFDEKYAWNIMDCRLKKLYEDL